MLICIGKLLKKLNLAHAWIVWVYDQAKSNIKGLVTYY